MRKALLSWLLAVISGTLAVQALSAQVPDPDRRTSSEAPVKVLSGFYGLVINGEAQPGVVYLDFDMDARPYMAVNDFRALQFSGTIPSVLRNGFEVVPLFGHAGMSSRIDSAHLILVLDVQAHWYAATRINLAAPHAGKPLVMQSGALLNYSFQVDRNDAMSIAWGSSQSLSLFGGQGMLQITTAVTLVKADPLPGQPSRRARTFSRLGTTWLRDDEARLATLSVGDGVMQAGVGVPGLRYGGISWQSNFGLDPTFSTLETPTIFDEARLPSTLEFFLNDRRVGRRVSVQPGPFEVSGLPTVDASGQVKVLIRDALDNERVVSVPYIHTVRLYREGLHSFSYTAGMLRPSIDRYEKPFFATSHRWGLTRWLTLDAGGSVSADRGSLGVGTTFPLGRNMVADASLALSKSPRGFGHQAGASLQWQTGASSAGASLHHASEKFRLLGDAADDDSGGPRDDLRLFAARALGERFGSISATFGRLSTWNKGTRTLVSAGWSKSFQNFSVSLNGAHSRTVGHAVGRAVSHTGGSQGRPKNTVLTLTVSIPLGTRGFISSSVQKQGASLSMRTDYATPPVTDTGMVYRIGVASARSPDSGTDSAYFAAVDARSSYGEHGLELAVRDERNNWRARTAGSVGVLAGRTFWGPPVTSGFALVSTGDAPGIPIYRWNQPVAVSDARGLALVTNLTPYQVNLLAVRPEEVPLQYRIDGTEVSAVPRGRGGVLVEFPVVRERPALLLLNLPGGHVVPAGASVKVLATGEIASVGLRGEAYLQNLSERAELEVHHQGRYCRVIVHHPVSADPQPRLGPYTCALGDAS